MPTISGFPVILADRVRETTTTTGTGTYSLNGAVTGFRTFVAGVGSGNRCPYTVSLGSSWEVGIGTVTSGAPATLSRDQILASSNSNNAVNWGAGTKDVFSSVPGALASQIVTLDASNWAAIWGGTSGGSANVQTIAPSPAIASYATGMEFEFLPGFTNTAINPTLNVNARGALTIKNPGGGTIGIGDLQVGILTRVRHDGTNLRLSRMPVTKRDAIATTSLTSHEFLGIRQNAKHLVFHLGGVSNNNTEPIYVQIGDSGGFEGTGYVSAVGETVFGHSIGFGINNGNAAVNEHYGHLNLVRADFSGLNYWTAAGAVNINFGTAYAVSGAKQLSAELDRIRITVVSGAFDAGFVGLTIME